MRLFKRQRMVGNGPERSDDERSMEVTEEDEGSQVIPVHLHGTESLRSQVVKGEVEGGKSSSMVKTVSVVVSWWR